MGSGLKARWFFDEWSDFQIRMMKHATKERGVFFNGTENQNDGC